MSNKSQQLKSRATRVRKSLKTSERNRLRLTVFRSTKNIYAQVIDDALGSTVCSASTLDKELRDELAKTSDKQAAAAVGKLLAKRAMKSKIGDVTFDRGSYLYHGRVKELAEAARSGGMKF